MNIERRHFTAIFSIFPISYRDFAYFYRDFLTALIIDLRSLTIRRLQSVDLSSIKSESEKQDTNVIEAAWP